MTFIQRLCTLLICLICPFISVLGVSVDSVRIFGNAPSYSGMTIVFERTSNFISREKQEIVRIGIDSKGNFDQTFALSETSFCFAELGVYRGCIYYEPGRAYQLELPPFTPMPLSDKFNPYFKLSDIELGVKNSVVGDVNVLIRDFDEAFDELYNQNAISIFAKADVAKAQSIVHQLDSLFEKTDIAYFESHREAQYGKLLNLAYKRQKRTSIAYTSQRFDSSIGLPAYNELFNDVFKDFFQYYFATTVGKPLRQCFGRTVSFDTLSMVLAQDSLFIEAAFRETVLIKALYDAYYTDRYGKEQIELLLQDSHVKCTTDLGKRLGALTYSYVTKLKKGTEAPDLTAVSAGGRSFSLSSFKGKFVYLSFANTQNHACKKDLIAMAALARDFKKDLEVVAIVTDEDRDIAFAFEKQNGIKYNFLHFNNNGKVLLDYNIKALPAYFLIDPEGNIISNSALPPNEEFVKFFQETVRNFKYKKARKTPDSPRSVYDL